MNLWLFQTQQKQVNQNHTRWSALWIDQEKGQRLFEIKKSRFLLKNLSFYLIWLLSEFQLKSDTKPLVIGLISLRLNQWN